MGHSKSVLAAIAVLGTALQLAYAAAGAGALPSATWPITPIAPPQDRAYAGDIQLSVDATDIARRVVRIHERVSGIGADTVLLYPKWLPGAHAPEGPIDKIAGIRITNGGTPVPWTRDPVDVYAFRLHPGAAKLSTNARHAASENSTKTAQSLHRRCTEFPQGLARAFRRG